MKKMKKVKMMKKIVQTNLTNITKFALFATNEILTPLDFQRACHHLNGCLRLLPKRQSGRGGLRSDLNSVKVGRQATWSILARTNSIHLQGSQPMQPIAQVPWLETADIIQDYLMFMNMFPGKAFMKFNQDITSLIKFQLNLFLLFS